MKRQRKESRWIRTGETNTAEFFTMFGDPIKYVNSKIDSAISFALVNESQEVKKKLQADLDYQASFLVLMRSASPTPDVLRDESMIELLIGDIEKKYNVTLSRAVLGYALYGVRHIRQERPELLDSLRDCLKKRTYERDNK